MTHTRTTRTLKLDSLEMLDERVVPSTTVPPIALPSPIMVAPAPVATSTTILTEKGSSALSGVYTQYMAHGVVTPVQAKQFFISGASIKLDITTSLANERLLISELKQLGMQVTATVTAGQVAVIEGFVPIAQLPTVAVNPGVIGMPPAHRPSFN